VKYLLIAVLFLSCEPTPEQKVLDWIKKAHKPVAVKGRGWQNTANRNVYTLRDADGCGLITPPVSLSLPDTIR